MQPDALLTLVLVRTLTSTGEARSRRTNAGLSLGEVAEAIGVSPSTVLRWERGERAPRGEAAVRYGQLLKQLGEVVPS